MTLQWLVKINTYVYRIQQVFIFPQLEVCLFIHTFTNVDTIKSRKFRKNNRSQKRKKFYFLLFMLLFDNSVFCVLEYFFSDLSFKIFVFRRCFEKKKKKFNVIHFHTINHRKNMQRKRNEQMGKCYSVVKFSHL